jgi:hypothetical protein
MDDQNPTDNPPALSFGFELEVVVGSATIQAALHIPRHKINISTLDENVYAYFINEMRQKGLRANVYLPTTAHTRPDYGAWNITSDATVVEYTSGSSMESLQSQSHLQRVGMEIISPIFDGTDQNWKKEIDKVSWCIDMPRLKTNSTTGFHVHIGSGDREFGVVELQRLAGYVIVFEGKTDFINGH